MHQPSPCPPSPPARVRDWRWSLVLVAVVVLGLAGCQARAPIPEGRQMNRINQSSRDNAGPLPSDGTDQATPVKALPDLDQEPAGKAPGSLTPASPSARDLGSGAGGEKLPTR